MSSGELRIAMAVFVSFALGVLFGLAIYALFVDDQTGRSHFHWLSKESRKTEDFAAALAFDGDGPYAGLNANGRKVMTHVINGAREKITKINLVAGDTLKLTIEVKIA